MAHVTLGNYVKLNDTLGGAEYLWLNDTFWLLLALLVGFVC